MAKQDDPKIPKRHQGVPRNYTTARKLGYKKSKVSFDDLSTKLKGQFVQLAEHGARENSLCGVVPSNDPRYWHVCYKDASGNCNWVDVPRGSAIPSHG